MRTLERRAVELIRFPIGLDRKTAVLSGVMKRVSYEAGQIWLQGLISLSAGSGCHARAWVERYALTKESTRTISTTAYGTGRPGGGQ